MKGNFKATTALALLDSTTVAAPQVKRFGEATAKVFQDIARTEKMNAQRAILIGLALPILKASMPRGEFRPWMEANVTQGNIWTKATAVKNASFYTRLALSFLDQAKPDASELLALTNGSNITGKIARKDVPAGILMKRLDEFVGEKSINELLEEHGIKNGGGSSSSSDAAALPADGDTFLQDIAQSLLNLRQTVTDPEQLKRLTGQQLSALERQFSDTVEDFRKAREALKSN